MKRNLKNLRPTEDRTKVIRQPGGRLVYDWDEFDELIYYILDTYVDPSKRRQGIATKMLETLFRRAKRDGAIISTGIFLADGVNLIPNLVYLATKHGVMVVP
jgi:GNAT superfamily N-acetyltransferase